MGAASSEWPAMLDVAAIMADGWSPVPFREFIVKIHSRCDLACDYCYMFEMADQSWRDKPRKMSRETAERTAARIGEHARAHNIPNIGLVLHGGEPLLAGRDLISCLVTAVRLAAETRVTVDTSVQTNAVGLDESYLTMFEDRHRRFASGRGSYNAVTASLRRLASDRYRHLFSGLLCTIDIRNDPLGTYEALTAFEPPKIDFLLPHGTWESPPPGRVPEATETPYADWLITIFDHWYSAPRTRIRLFDEIMRLILGEDSVSEIVGLAPSRLLVIETDGAIEQGDTLKIAYHGAPETGLHVDRNRLDEALLLPGVAARQFGERGLCATCRACPIRRVCGGGLYAHRYRVGTGFANPSVYCPDLIRLIGHIHDTMRADISARFARREAS
jgi:uncharacterized protein